MGERNPKSGDKVNIWGQNLFGICYHATRNQKGQIIMTLLLARFIGYRIKLFCKSFALLAKATRLPPQ